MVNTVTDTPKILDINIINESQKQLNSIGKKYFEDLQTEQPVEKTAKVSKKAIKSLEQLFEIKEKIISTFSLDEYVSQEVMQIKEVFHKIHKHVEEYVEDMFSKLTDTGINKDNIAEFKKESEQSLSFLEQLTGWNDSNKNAKKILSENKKEIKGLAKELAEKGLTEQEHLEKYFSTQVEHLSIKIDMQKDMIVLMRKLSKPVQELVAENKVLKSKLKIHEFFLKSIKEVKRANSETEEETEKSLPVALEALSKISDLAIEKIDANLLLYKNVNTYLKKMISFCKEIFAGFKGVVNESAKQLKKEVK